MPMRKILSKIKSKLRPQSFRMKKTVTIRNSTEHHPDGIGSNVIGFLEGAHPDLKKEVIIIGGHLDHLGRCYEIMPGANDNASAVSVILGVAEALTNPRLDAARFMWKDIPTISFSAYGSPSFYHLPKDDISTITPEILEDLAQLVFWVVVDLANQESVDFRE
ncbi:hypothetical protein B6I21_04630 [candidate division KSB1 bacterium 4572_119]|nr:MAG: hypothetical protein B6I21_04630 [candidate division KSB1 bacterium 4572_119]